MDKIVYLYGSARDAETRALRHAAKPRQMVFRLGPWTVRPSRRVAIEFPRLAPHKDELLHKISQGILQLQSGDGAVFSIVEINAAFAELVGTPDAPDYNTMPYAQLMGLMRTEKPTQEVWDAFVTRSIASNDPELPSAETRIRSLMDYSRRVAELGLSTEASDRVLEAALIKAQAASDAAQAAELAAEEARVEAEKERAAKLEAETTPPATEETSSTEPPQDDAPPPSDADAPDESPEQMDFTPPEETAPSADVVAPPEETETTEKPKAALPEGWRGLPNAKLKELITSVGATMPEQVSKANLISALEAWLGGS